MGSTWAQVGTLGTRAADQPSSRGADGHAGGTLAPSRARVETRYVSGHPIAVGEGPCPKGAEGLGLSVNDESCICFSRKLQCTPRGTL